jgi:hypothetical protein
VVASALNLVSQLAGVAPVYGHAYGVARSHPDFSHETETPQEWIGIDDFLKKDVEPSAIVPGTESTFLWMGFFRDSDNNLVGLMSEVRS